MPIITFKPLYGTSNQSLTITVNSLTTGSSTFCTAVNNSGNLYMDYLVAGTFSAGAASTSATGTISVIVAASSDGGTTYTSRTQDCKLLAILDCSANNAVPKLDPTSVAALYGGIAPQFFQIGVINNSGGTLAAGGNSMWYQGLYEQGV